MNTADLPIVSIHALTARYGKNEPVLKNVSFSVSAGELVCLIGANGSGKTTLLSLICGIPEDGLENISADPDTSILLDEKSIGTYRRKELSEKISYLPQNEQLIWNYTVHETVAAGRYIREGIESRDDTERIVREKLRLMSLEHYADTGIFELSGGEQQRTYTARALAQETPVFVFDEPAAHLDIHSSYALLADLRKLCKEQNHAGIISLHDINAAPVFADTLILMAHGSVIAAGTPEQVFTGENLEQAFGCPFKTFVHPVWGKVQACPDPMRRTYQE